MKKFFTLLLLSFSFVLAAAEINWQTDFAAAAKAAKETKKPVVMLFTGSDWCPPCMRMAKETWQNAAVIDYVNKNCIPLLVDLPRRKQFPPEQVRKNQQLAEKYKLQFFPTIVVTDADGKELGRTGFSMPDDFLTFLKKY